MVIEEKVTPATDEEIAAFEATAETERNCTCYEPLTCHDWRCSDIARLIARIRQERDGRADDQILCVRRVAEVTRERNDLRAELAAADQNLKTMLQAAGEEAERQLAAEKARADRAEARVRELEDEIVAWRNAQAVKFLGEAGEVEARPRRWQAEVKLNGVADAILATRARKGNNIVDAPCGAPVLSPVPCQGSAEEGSEGDTESPRRVSYFSKVVGPVTGPFEDLRICFGSSTADPRAPAQTGDLSVRTCARCGNVHTQPLILPEASHEQQQQGHHHLVLESPPGHTSEGSASSNPASCSPRTRTSVEPSADSTGEPSDPQARLNDGTKS